MSRVLLVSSNSSSRGGGERYLVYLTRGLRALGHEVHVLLSRNDFMDGWSAALAGEGAVVHRLATRPLVRRRLRFLSAILDRPQHRAIAEACRRIGPDAIVVNQQYDEDGLDYLTGALQADLGPVAGVMHLPMTASKDRRPLGKYRGALLRWWYRRHPYRLAFVSEGCQKEFEAYYRHPRPTYVVHNGVPFDEHPTAELPVQWSDDRPVVGFVGQFVEQKDLRLLVDAWLDARARGAESRLLLVGDGPTRPAVEARLRTHADAPWHITGWVSEPEAWFGVIDLLLMTSHYEGLSLALVEAAGRGVPAVVTEFNGARDVGARAAWVTVVPERTAPAVGAVLAEGIASNDRQKRQAAMGCAEFRAYFSPERMARDLLGVLGLA